MTARILPILILAALCALTQPVLAGDSQIAVEVAAPEIAAEIGDDNSITLDGFTGGVGQGQDQGGMVVIQMLQGANTGTAAASSAATSAASSAYVRPVLGSH